MKPAISLPVYFKSVKNTKKQKQKTKGPKKEKRKKKFPTARVKPRTSDVED